MHPRDPLGIGNTSLTDLHITIIPP
ncbi:hypothetical protein FRAHR75_1690008 [Frankia sp. Hr75.2]|nr:hypothetical protein FRAHR75_1690008 [Frankia sp. Hr75.2]SQD97311.1 hypothetical protein FMEAI12_4020041 [Parafrankia sp. Ea1.12]